MIRVVVAVLTLLAPAAAAAEPVRATPYTEFALGVGSMTLGDGVIEEPVPLKTVRVANGIVVQGERVHGRFGVTAEILGIDEPGLASGLEAELDAFVSPGYRAGVRGAASFTRSIPVPGTEERSDGQVLSVGLRVRSTAIGGGVDLLRVRNDQVTGSGVMLVANLGDLAEMPMVVRVITIGLTALAAIALDQNSESR